MIPLIIGSVTFVAGAALWFFTSPGRARAEPRSPAAWLPQLGLALVSLGLSTLASTRRGVGWSISSICFSVIAIVLIVVVLRENMRR